MVIHQMNPKVIQIKCPHCGTRYKIIKPQVDKKYRCKNEHCKKIIVVKIPFYKKLFKKIGLGAAYTGGGIIVILASTIHISLYLLAIIIYFFSLIISFHYGVISFILTIILPPFSQIFWFIKMIIVTHTIFNLYGFLCIIFIGLIILLIILTSPMFFISNKG